MKHLLILLAFFLFSGALHASKEEEDILSYSGSEQRKFCKGLGRRFPLAAHYYNDDGQEVLRYIAAKHVGVPATEDAIKEHATFQLIQMAFEEFKPDFVIAEGFNNQEYVIDWMKQAENTLGIGESSFTVHLAIKNDITFAGGEPIESDILIQFQKLGYTATDLLSMNLIDRAAQAWRRKDENLKGPEDLESYINEIAKQYIYTEETQQYKYDNFKAWCQKHYNRLLTFNEITDTEFAAPIPNGHRVQKLSSASCLIRDREIIQRILDNKDKYKRILVVYGASHLYCQHKALEKHFGKPTVSSPNTGWCVLL